MFVRIKWHAKVGCPERSVRGGKVEVHLVESFHGVSKELA